MIVRGIVGMMAVALAGCDTIDPRMGVAIAQNTAAHQAAVRDMSVPLEGGSAALGTAAVKRYLSGTVRQPGDSTSEPASNIGGSTPSPSPR